MMLFSQKLKKSTQAITKKGIGDKYEQLASHYLARHSLTWLAQNFTTKFGEIDLIMKDKECIVFVEVKYRKQHSHGDAAEFVTRAKQQKLIRTAYVWLNQQGLQPQSTCFRFDVVAIHKEGDDINWIKNAITQD
jgi:putative endonuclease